jgi:hypothetical protein
VEGFVRVGAPKPHHAVKQHGSRFGRQLGAVLPGRETRSEGVDKQGRVQRCGGNIAGRMHLGGYNPAPIERPPGVVQHVVEKIPLSSGIPVKERVNNR